MDLYFQQSSQNRLSSEENVSGIVGEVLENIFNFPSEFSVVSKGLTLLEMIAMDFSWQCVHHFENLSSLIQVELILCQFACEIIVFLEISQR